MLDCRPDSDLGLLTNVRDIGNWLKNHNDLDLKEPQESRIPSKHNSKLKMSEDEKTEKRLLTKARTN